MTHTANQSVMDYYIHNFVTKQKDVIKGKCLILVTENTRTSLLTDVKGDIVHVSMSGNELKNIPQNSYDTVIALNTLNCIAEYESAIADMIKALKPDGSLICTLSAFAPTHDSEQGLWGFTENSTRFVFGKFFDNDYVSFTGYGNVLSGRYFLNSRPAEELTTNELDYYDMYFPLLIGVHAQNK